MASPKQTNAHRGPGRSRKLDRSKIVEAARALVREQGLAKLTMRGIAGQLEVDPAALYWHFADKAELLDAISNTAAREISFDLSRSGRWQDRARALCIEVRDRLHGQPELLIMGHRDPTLAPYIVQATGAATQVLSKSGLQGEALIFAAHTLIHTVTAVLEAQVAQSRSEPTAVRSYMHDLASLLPDSESEKWLEVARRDPTHSFDAYFDHAVDIVIAGISAHAAADAREI